MLRDLNRLIDINTLFRGQRDIIWFIKEMNSNANKFGLLSTFYDSPHGLSNSLNYSTAEDQWILISHLMKDELFRKNSKYSKLYLLFYHINLWMAKYKSAII